MLALSFIHTWRPRLGSDSGFSFKMSHVLFVATELRCHQESLKTFSKGTWHFKQSLKVCWGKGWAFHSWHRVPLLQRLVAVSLSGFYCPIVWGQGYSLHRAASRSTEIHEGWGRALCPGEPQKGVCHRFPDYRCGWLLGLGPGAPWLVQASSCSALPSDLLPMSPIWTQCCLSSSPASWLPWEGNLHILGLECPMCQD